MAIPEHKLLSPSEAVADHMLLPTLSVQEMQKINDIKLAKRQKSINDLTSVNPVVQFKTPQEKSDDAKYKLSFN